MSGSRHSRQFGVVRDVRFPFDSDRRPRPPVNPVGHQREVSPNCTTNVLLSTYLWTSRRYSSMSSVDGSRVARVKLTQWHWSGAVFCPAY